VTFWEASLSWISPPHLSVTCSLIPAASDTSKFPRGFNGAQPINLFKGGGGISPDFDTLEQPSAGDTMAEVRFHVVLTTGPTGGPLGISIDYLRIENADGFVLIAVYLFIYSFICSLCVLLT